MAHRSRVGRPLPASPEGCMKPRLLLAAFAVWSLAGSAWAATGRPNVLLIIGDDQGWTDFAFTGRPVVRTVASESAGVAGGGVPECLRDVPAVSAESGLHHHRGTGLRRRSAERSARGRAAADDAAIQQEVSVPSPSAAAAFVPLAPGHCRPDRPRVEAVLGDFDLT